MLFERLDLDGVLRVANVKTFIMDSQQLCQITNFYKSLNLP